MRKSRSFLAAGLAISLMALAGCSRPVEAETMAPTEAFVQTEATEADTEAETEPEKEREETADSQADGKETESLLAPLRIWGTITEATEEQMIVDNQSPASSSGEMIFHIDPENTRVLDAVNGFPVSAGEVEKGSFEAYLGPAMTMSLPPQTTPYLVIVNIPADFSAPRYVIAAGPVEEEEKSRVLQGIGGEKYKISEEAQILPYLTRNIVAMEDIQAGSGCLVWLNADDVVEKIVLFAQ